MLEQLPEPVADDIQHQLNGEAAQEEDVEAVEYFSEGSRLLVLVQELSVELGLRNGEDEILQSRRASGSSCAASSINFVPS
jgi:hypothetical protein